MDEIRVNGARLRAIRKERGLTQGQLELKAKVGQGHISKIESGKRPNAKIATVAALAAALDVPIEDLVIAPGKTRAAGAVREENNLPDFRWYIDRKLRDSPALRDAIVRMYEAYMMEKEEAAKKERERQKEFEKWQERYRRQEEERRGKQETSEERSMGTENE